MNKALAIALKDFRQSFRSFMAVMFMFVVPIGLTALLWLMLGGASADSEEMTLPRTTVYIANLDAGAANVPTPLGAVLIRILQADNFADLLLVSEADSAAAARRAVDNQTAGVALIIPADFSMAATTTGANATVELYQDPTLTIGPQIVEAIVSQLIDGFSAGNLTLSAAMAQMTRAGIDITPQRIMALVEASGLSGQIADEPAFNLTVRPPTGTQTTNRVAALLSLMMGGMMVFYTFFTASATMQSILTEQEKGTLQRLFSTPTSHLAIIGGKVLATVLLLVVQVATLLLFGRLVFGLDWGDPLRLAIAALSIIMLAATTGVFIISLLKSARQGGVVFGGVLTLTGMLGLINVFTAGQITSPTINVASLLVPQGWAIRILQQAIDGADVDRFVLTFGVVLLWCAVFAFIGQRRLQRRFA